MADNVLEVGPPPGLPGRMDFLRSRTVGGALLVIAAVTCYALALWQPCAVLTDTADGTFGPNGANGIKMYIYQTQIGLAVVLFIPAVMMLATAALASHTNRIARAATAGLAAPSLVLIGIAMADPKRAFGYIFFGIEPAVTMDAASGLRWAIAAVVLAVAGAYLAHAPSLLAVRRAMLNQSVHASRLGTPIEVSVEPQPAGALVASDLTVTSEKSRH